MYGDPRTSDLWAQLWLARRRADRWRRVKAWMFGLAAAAALFATGIVWPT